jgi:hypothetical protein
MVCMTWNEAAARAFSEAELPALCDKLGSQDAALRRVIDEFGYPPCWHRPNTFESFVWFILEQQSCLALLPLTEETAPDGLRSAGRCRPTAATRDCRGRFARAGLVERPVAVHGARIGIGGQRVGALLACAAAKNRHRQSAGSRSAISEANRDASAARSTLLNITYAGPVPTMPASCASWASV